MALLSASVLVCNADLLTACIQRVCSTGPMFDEAFFEKLRSQ